MTYAANCRVGICGSCCFTIAGRRRWRISCALTRHPQSSLGPSNRVHSHCVYQYYYCSEGRSIRRMKRTVLHRFTEPSLNWGIPGLHLLFQKFLHSQSLTSQCRIPNFHHVQQSQSSDCYPRCWCYRYYYHWSLVWRGFEDKAGFQTGAKHSPAQTYPVSASPIILPAGVRIFY